MKNYEIYGKLLEFFNNKQYVFTVEELAADLGNTARRNVEKVLHILLKEHIIRSVSNVNGVYEFCCDYHRFRAYLLDLDRPISSKKMPEAEIVSKEEMIKAKWVLQMDVCDDSDAISEIDDEYDEYDDDDDFSWAFEEIKAAASEKENLVEKYNKAKELVIKHMQAHSGHEGVLSLAMNITYPSGAPFKIAFHFDDEKHELFFTDDQATYQYICSIMDTSETATADTAQYILKKFASECSLVCIDKMLCVPINLDIEVNDFDHTIFVLIKKINDFISKRDVWFITPEEEIERKVSEFITQTMQKTYSYSSIKVFEAVTIDIIEKIVLIDYRLSREKAVEIAKRLKGCGEKNNASKGTLKIFSRVQQEFELCSDREYEALKVQLHSEKS